MKLTRQRKTVARDGCGFLVLTCLFTCFFLVLNSVLVSEFYPYLAAVGPSLLRRTRVEQVMLFTAPVALLFVEWWLVDLLVDVLTPRGNSRDEPWERSSATRSEKKSP